MHGILTIRQVKKEIAAALPGWPELIERSFLSAEARGKYLKIVAERAARLGLPWRPSADESSA